METRAVVNEPTASDKETSPPGVTIFQFWDQDMPAAVRELVDSIRLANPSFEYVLYDDERAREFIRAELGGEMADIYDLCAMPAMRADLFRYSFLVRRGGLYLDADYRAVGPVDSLIKPSTAGSLLSRSRGLANGMMFSREPEAPLMSLILERAIGNIGKRSSNSVWQVTGPGVLQTLHGNDKTRPLFEDYFLVDEEHFSKCIVAPPLLDYKNSDTHWSTARDRGISIFRDPS